MTESIKTIKGRTLADIKSRKDIQVLNNKVGYMINITELGAVPDDSTVDNSVIIQKDKKLLIIKKITSIMKQEIERTIKQSYDIEDKLIPYYSDIIPSVLINNFSLYLKDGSSLSWEEVEGVIYDCLLNGLSSLKVK